MYKFSFAIFFCLFTAAFAFTGASANTKPYIRFWIGCECCNQGIPNVAVELYENNMQIDADVTNYEGYVFFDMPDSYVSFDDVKHFSVRSSAPVIDGLNISLGDFFQFTEFSRIFSVRAVPWTDPDWGARPINPMIPISPTADYVLYYHYGIRIPMSTLVTFGMASIPIPRILLDENEAQGIGVAVNGVPIAFETQRPIIQAETVFVPARNVFERLGFYVHWDCDMRQAVLTRDDDSLRMIPGRGFSFNDEYHPLVIPAQMENEVVFLPICALAQMIDYALFWNNETQTLHIATGAENGYIFIQGEAIATTEWALGLPSRGLTNADIRVLRYMRNLRHLHLNDNQISDITPLEDLRQLRHLNLRDNQVADLSPLSRLFSLGRLDLTNNPVSTWVPVANLSWVWGRDSAFDLDIDGSAAENQTDGDYIVIQGQRISKTLTELYLHTWYLTDNDIAPLQYMKNLNFLVLGWNDITDLTPLANLTGLEVLWLSGNNIEDLSPLSGLTNLRELILSSNQISDLSPLAHLTGLETLWLSSNSVQDISPLAYLTSLEKLYMNRNRMSDLKPLESLVNLEVLWLDDNEISNISPLANLTLLWQLSLNNNHVSDLTSLKGLTGLQFVSLRDNPIEDWTPVAHVIRVER